GDAGNRGLGLSRCGDRSECDVHLVWDRCGAKPTSRARPPAFSGIARLHHLSSPDHDVGSRVMKAVVMKQNPSQPSNAEPTTPEEQLLAKVLRFKEARRDPRSNGPLGDAWEEFLVCLVRRMNRSDVFSIGNSR